MSSALYYLIYKPPKRSDKKDAELSLRELSLSSKDFIRIGGHRAYTIFGAISRVLNMYALKYNKRLLRQKTVIELPADVGYAILIYLLLTYGTTKPDNYLPFLEKMLAGKIPLSNYIATLVNLAVDLSEIKGDKRRTVVSNKAARIISKILRILYKSLK